MVIRSGLVTFQSSRRWRKSLVTTAAGYAMMGMEEKKVEFQLCGACQLRRRPLRPAGRTHIRCRIVETMANATHMPLRVGETWRAFAMLCLPMASDVPAACALSMSARDGASNTCMQ